MSIPDLDAFAPDILVEHLYDQAGTSTILLALEALHRRDAQRVGDDRLQVAADHRTIAGALQAARVVSDDLATRLRSRGGR